jgi:hypothetical protein
MSARRQQPPQAAPAAAPRKGSDPAAQEAQSKYGLTEGTRYEFKDGRKLSSWVVVGKDTVSFVDRRKKTFATLKYETLLEVLITVGEKLHQAGGVYASSEQFRDSLVRQYFAVFRPGNRAAKNEAGSGQFRYEISEQHLADSVSNELKHVGDIIGLEFLRDVASRFAEKDPGMECWGTAMQNVLKARGVVPPTLTRQQFEAKYARIVSELPEDSRGAMYGKLSPLKRLGQDGTARTIQQLAKRLSQTEWAQFTGMSAKVPAVRLLKTIGDVENSVKRGYAVFVGVPGHYKSAVGGNRERFDYDDPLGFWGHRLYDDRPVRFGVVIE